jgi:hypothetical protein
MKPGAKAEITYLRDGRERSATIALAPQPGERDGCLSCGVESPVDRALANAEPLCDFAPPVSNGVGQ